MAFCMALEIPLIALAYAGAPHFPALKALHAICVILLASRKAYVFAVFPGIIARFPYIFTAMFVLLIAQTILHTVHRVCIVQHVIRSLFPRDCSTLWQ